DLQVLDPRIEWLDGQAYLRLRLLNESSQVHAAPLITADIIDQDNLLTAQMTCEIPAFAPEHLIYLRIPVPAGYDTDWLDDEGIAAVDAFVTINPGSTPDNVVPLSFGDLPVRQTDVTPTQTVLRITAYNARSHPIQEITIVLDAIDSDGHPLGPWIGTVAADVDPQREFTFQVTLPTDPSHPLRNLNVRGYAIKP
ncbi:MAG: hypothetical protein CMJ49_01730, partial [Planctomycetaceae bacterium]|nr:hypothetical protein [Planctomycetaceae bacterium]